MRDHLLRLRDPRRRALASLLVLSDVALGCTNAEATPASSGTLAAETSSNAEGRVTVRGLVGIGTGAEPEQVAAQEAIVEEFNATHDDVQFQIEIVDNPIAVDTLQGYFFARPLSPRALLGWASTRTEERARARAA